MRVAIIGSGISGLAVAHTLQGRAELTLYEAEHRFGGHAHTVDVTLPVQGQLRSHGVDTGFLVYNERTYPNLINLFASLGVPTARSDMSFSVQVPQAGLEWSGSSLNTVFAQRRNLFSGAFLRMLADLLRFNRQATRLARQGDDTRLMQPLGEFLQAQGYSAHFRDWYLLPMLGCIWSCPTDQMLQFPVATLVRFCHNHGLLQISDRPQWHTVQGGSREYVQRIVSAIPDRRLLCPVRLIERDEDGVRVVTDGRVERFDHVVLATHADQSLRLLRDADAEEQSVLGRVRYQRNEAVLHTDERVLPQRRSAWAAWNYERSARDGAQARVCLHYLINRLQPLPWPQPVIVSLNPVRAIDEAQVLGRYDYAHPVFDLEAIRAQDRIPGLQGRRNTWFCGAWTGYGFHEDGLKSGLGVARSLLLRAAADSP